MNNYFRSMSYAALEDEVEASHDASVHGKILCACFKYIHLGEIYNDRTVRIILISNISNLNKCL